MTAAVHGERSPGGASARWAWLVLASIVAVVAVVGVAAGSICEYQVSSCEIIDATATCMMSTLDIVGWGATAVVVGAALLCAVPALWPRPAVRWGSVAALVLLGVGSLIMLGRIGFPVVAVALLGAALAAAQGWHTSRRHSTHDREIEVPLKALLGRSVGPDETNGSS